MRTRYKAYLLRLRRGEGQPHWWATLEDAHTGELLHFAHHTELLRYLLQQLTDRPSRSEPPPHSEDARE